MSEEAKKILVKYWGHPGFRPMQEEIIQSVLSGEDTLALLPTGGGKSICFQVPAMMRDGVCLVITPLIALMKDQVDNLKRNDIPAGAIYSGMHPMETESVYSRCIHKEIKFLYVSPERLSNPTFQDTIARTQVNLITVDEAHCISQWGYDFRPTYLRIAEIKTLVSDAPLMALTATATPKVVEDIMQKLTFRKPNLYKASFERKNLSYNVLREPDKTGKLIQLLSDERGSAVVYVRNRRKTRELADILSKNQITSVFYHAGLDAKTREERQKMWTQSRVRVMVATNAFGMGIDKPDVRQVVHYDLPDCLESYFQEAGRAGRDGKSSMGTLIYSSDDVTTAKKRLKESFPPVKKIRKIYNAIGNYLQVPEGSGKELGYDFIIADFARHYNLGIVEVYSAIKFLEREGYLMYVESAGQYSRLLIPVGKEELYRYLVEHPGSDRFIKEILRSYAGVFTEYININEAQLAKRVGMDKKDVIEKLSYLSKLKIISYIPIKAKPQLIYSIERLGDKNIFLSDENYEHLKLAAKERLQHLLDFISNSLQCRSQQLLAYFGESKSKRCGICDVCTGKNKVELNEIEFENIKNKIKNTLAPEPQHLFQLVSGIDGFGEEDVISVLQWLLDNKKVIRQKDERLMWYDQLDMDF
jgi:ATP-dependent DNA helicase RecQ